jgi:penicillin-binding protein 2
MGTAWRVHIEDIAVVGKTGTAQVVGRKAEEPPPEGEIPAHLKAHAWFTAYAPAAAPEIAVTVLIEHGEHGSSAAAPLAMDLIRTYLND